MRAWPCILMIVSAVAAGCDGGESATATVVETLAGGSIGDGLLATEAPLQAIDVAVDRQGDVLLADHNRVRRIDARTGRIETVVGGEAIGGCGEDGPAAAACLVAITGLALDERGDLLVSDGVNGRVLRTDLASGTLAPIVGCLSERCFSPGPVDDTPALATYLSRPTTLTAGGEGDVFVTDSDTGRVLRLAAAGGEVQTVAGNGDTESGGEDCPDDVPATSTCIRYGGGLAVDPDGGLLISSGRGFAVRRVDPVTGLITAVVGRRGDCDPASRGDDGPATAACLQAAVAVASGARGDLFISDPGDDRVRRVDAETGIVSTLVQGSPEAPLRPTRLTVSSDGDVVVLAGDLGGIQVLRVDPATGVTRVIGGNGTRDHCGDGGPARDACLGEPRDLAVAPDDAVLVSETGRIRRIDPRSGIISTIAGGGTVPPGPAAGCPDGVAATSTCLNWPDHLAVDRGGSVFILEWDFSSAGRSPRIRRVDASSGEIVTVAGGCPDGLAITEPEQDASALGACLFPKDIAADADGGLLFASFAGIWRVDEATGRLRHIAGGSTPGFCGDGGPATSACLSPQEIAVAPDGDVLVLDGSAGSSTRVRRIDTTTGMISTVAGSGTEGQCGDGGPATDACLLATHVVVDAAGDLFIGGNGLVRRVDATTGVITTVAGDPARLFGPGQDIVFAPAVSVMAIDSAGRLLYLDGADGSRVQRITLARDR